jgi:hypothetical protein
MKTREYLLFQLHVPVFVSSQVLVKLAPGATVVPSGMVTSRTKAASLQPEAVEVDEVEVEPPVIGIPAAGVPVPFVAIAVAGRVWVGAAMGVCVAGTVAVGWAVRVATTPVAT